MPNSGAGGAQTVLKEDGDGFVNTEKKTKT